MSENEYMTLTNMLSELCQRIARIEERLSIVPMCGNNCSQGKIEDLEKRIALLEKDKTWLGRLIIGVVVAAILGLVVKGASL